MTWLTRRPRQRQGWRTAEFVALDLETSGLDHHVDDVLAYGLVVLRSARLIGSTASEGLVLPTRPVAPASTKIHSLRTADLGTAPPLEAAVATIAAALEGRVLVAHASWVETGFLRRAFGAVGLGFDPPVVDTAALARALGWAPSGRRAEPSLEWLCVSHRLPLHTPHTALGDAMSTAGLFLAECAHLEADRTAPGLSLSRLLTTSRRFSLR